MIPVELLERLCQPEGAKLVESVARALDDHPLSPADVQRWRASADAATVTAAIELATARASLRGRIAAADAFWCDRPGAAQASDDLSAQWKAQRAMDAASLLRARGLLPGDGGPVLVDYCCGTGADLAHFALALDGRVEGADLREDRAWMARRNSRASVEVQDVRSWRSHAPLAHIDPSRRDEASGTRRHGWESLEPGPAVLEDLWSRHAGVMVKLGPGTDVPFDARPAGSELAILSREGSLSQAVLCTGACARARAAHSDSAGFATAVLLRAGHAPAEIAGPGTWTSGRGDSDWACARAWGRIVAEPDPSLERSGLLSCAARALGLAEVHPGLGLCTDIGEMCDIAAVERSPWWRTWELIARAPARLDDLRPVVREQRAGCVDVKVRGGAANADEWSRALRSESGAPLTVFVHRAARAGTEALIARRRTPA